MKDREKSSRKATFFDLIDQDRHLGRINRLVDRQAC